MHAFAGSAETPRSSAPVSESNTIDLLPVVDYGYSAIRRAASSCENRTTGRFQSFELDSAFQPIFSLAHKRVVGYEALVRANNQSGDPVSPALLFSSVRNPSELIFLDRLCRYVHVDNYMRMHDPVRWLFLNVAPHVVIHGKDHGPFFGEMLKQAGLPPHQVVVEVVEEPTVEPEALALSTEFYKETGCLLAIDDFGSGHSNFERVWSMSPHIIKLERSMIERADSQPRVRQMLPGIVSLLHQSGAQVLMEGIETESQAIIAVEAEVDFVQGYYFARPSMDLNDAMAATHDFNALFTACKSADTVYKAALKSTYQTFSQSFFLSVRDLNKDENFDSACHYLFCHDAVIRCYLLDPSGVQIGPTAVPDKNRGRLDPRFHPLHDARDADWFRRHYLRRAVLHPDQLQVTRPYMSITGEAMCVTLSMMFETDSGPRIFCCDLDWESYGLKNLYPDNPAVEVI